MLARWDGEAEEPEIAAYALAEAMRSVTTFPETVANLVAAMFGKKTGG